MNKLLCLVMSVMVLGMGVVSAAVDFSAPASGTYVKTNIPISWENGTYATSNLMYNSGACVTSGTIILSNIVSVGSHTWNIASLTEGLYCIKIADGITTHGSISVTIDRTAPNITFTGTPYSVIKNNPKIINAIVNDTNLNNSATINFGDNSGDKPVTISGGKIIESHTYNASGEYTVTVTARDVAGNTKTATTTVLVNDKLPDWQIDLRAGKTNMFSIPLIPTSTAIASVLPKSVSDKANTIWTYQKGAWKYNTPTTTGWSTSSSRLQEIVPGYGYIIFMNSDAVAYGNGKSLGQDTPPEVVLTTGWNLIGHYGNDESGVEIDGSENSEGVFSSLELGNNNYWNSVLFINSEGKFESLGTTDKLYPTEAYWLSIKSLNLADGEKRYFSYMPSQECY